MRIWIDIKNSHEPLFFKTFIKAMPKNKFYVTCRDYAEIVRLLETYGIQHKVIGSRIGGPIPLRAINFGQRVLRLALDVPTYDILLNHCSVWGIYASRLRHRMNVTFTDNEIDHPLNRWMFRFVDHLIVPKSIPKEILVKDHMKEDRILQYDGFKEDIYVADYFPDPQFLASLPFRDYVMVRPEALDALYIGQDAKTIVPELLKEFARENFNILFLPRYGHEENMIPDTANLVIPQRPLNGLDVCYHSKAVLTGSGTFSREAALMGVPAISFYPGNEMLAVDRDMIERGWVFHSRDPKEIVQYVIEAKRREINPDRSIHVQSTVISLLNEILLENGG